MAKRQATKKPLANILIKPVGPDCNLSCNYCFYLKKKSLFASQNKHRMNEQLLKETVRQAIDQSTDEIFFSWQGGEPTLASLDFFSRAVELQKRNNSDQRIGNSLQTNGLLLDRKWAEFLTLNDFLVGLSIDGPEHIHDKYRKGRSGKGTFKRVCDKAKLLLDAGTQVNALSVVTDYSVNYPAEIYEFLKELGLCHMQFIPAVEKLAPGTGDLAPFTCPPEGFGKFLCETFDLWFDDFQNGVPSTSIRLFDSVFYNYIELQPPDCCLLEECGVYLVVEHNGDVFSCDFFVEPGWRLGNIGDQRLVDLLNSERQRGFASIKARLPRECLDCRWLAYCRGGCPKDRVGTGQGANLNHLCQSFKMFFEHSHGRLEQLASDWIRTQPERMNMEREAQQKRQGLSDSKVGRNDPCPCGSGIKYKKCCIGKRVRG